MSGFSAALRALQKGCCEGGARRAGDDTGNQGKGERGGKQEGGVRVDRGKDAETRMYACVVVVRGGLDWLRPGNWMLDGENGAVTTLEYECFAHGPLVPFG